MASHVVSLVCFLFPVLWDAILGFPEVVYNPEFRWIEQGDINFGAILSIHSTDSLFSCTDTIQDVRNIQTVEALNFAVKEINDRQDILQNLTLGFYILDDCLSTPLALARAIQFMPRDIREARPVQDNVSGIPIGPNGDVHFYDVFGVIGAYTSKLSMVVANVLNIFSLPQISYSATSNALSDKSRFPYFFRMVPPDFYQVRTIASLLRMFNWTHVSTVFSEGTYGRDGVKVLENVFHKMGNDICIEQKIEISYGSEKQDFRTVLDKLAGKINTPVVVAFLEIGDVKMLVESIREAGMEGRFVWVGSDSLNLILEESPERCNIFPSSISVRPHSSLNDKLKDHLRLLFDKKENQNNTRNPWINELLTRGHAFHGDEDHEMCLLSHQGEHLRPRFIDSLIIDSVYAFAHALDKTIKRVCPDYLLNSLDISKCVSRTAVYNELKTLTFNGPSGVVAFNKDGDVMTKYEIFQCQENVLKSEVKSIGSWFMENESLQMELERVLWKQNKFPISACPKPCTEMTGSIYYFTKQTCCHVCVGCKVNEIATTNATRCEICPEMYWPDDSRSTCIKIPPFFFGLQNPIAVTLVSIAVVGGIFCLFITCVLFTYRNKHVVKCFSLELSGIILAGTAVAFCLTGVLVSEPSTVKCFISHVGFSFTFTVIYAPLLIKTNRIYRIFNAGKRTTKRPRFISNSSQVIMAAILISLQVSKVLFPVDQILLYNISIVQLPYYSARYAPLKNFVYTLRPWVI